MTLNTLNNLQGKMLVAVPSLTDDIFERGVCLICSHNQEGAIGIVINRAIEMTEKDLLEDQKLAPNEDFSFDEPVYRGGPMHTDRGFIVHQTGAKWRSTNQVSDQIFITTSQDILQAIAAGEIDKNYLIALGYAAWEPGQLEQEITDNTWFIIDASEELIFKTPYYRRWIEAMHQLGIHNLAQLCCDQEGHA